MPLFYNRIKEQLLFFDSQKTKMVIFFSILSNMLLNIDSISNAVFYSVFYTQYNQPNSRKNKSIM